MKATDEKPAESQKATSTSTDQRLGDENGAASAATPKKLGTSLAAQMPLAAQRTRAPTPTPI